MHTQLQAVSLRIQTIKSNQQMGEAMRGASRVGLFLYLLIRTLFIVNVGHGSYESSDQFTCHAKDHERL